MRISDWSSDVCSSDLAVSLRRGWSGHWEYRERHDGAASGSVPALRPRYQVRFRTRLAMKPVASPPSRHSVTVEAGLANYDTCRHKMTGRGSAFAHLSLVKNREVITAWEFGAPVGIVEHGRSEEPSGGKECVSTCRSRWSQDHTKKNKKLTKH